MSYRLLAIFLLFAFNLSAQKFSCGFEGEEAHIIKLNASKLRALEDGTLYECPIVFTIPYEEYLLFDQDEQAIKRFLYEKFDFVNALYLQSANTQFRITGIFIAKSAEDNRQMATYWNSFSQDSIPRKILHSLAILTGTERGGGAVGNLADEGLIYSYSRNLSKLTNTEIMLHELGHNFGSYHTQDYVWDGKPLDMCAGNVYGAQSKDDFIGFEDKVGTIMSYCTEAISLTFHPTVSKLLKQYASTYLAPISTIPPKPYIQKSQEVNHALTPYLEWNSVSGALKYRFQLSENEGFSSILIDSLVTFQQFQAFGLQDNRTYHWRVRAENKQGASEWTLATYAVQGAGSHPPSSPVMIAPKYLEERLAGSLPTELVPIQGASSYMYSFNDDFTKNNVVSNLEMSDRSRFVLNTRGSGSSDNSMYVKARAFNYFGQGPWSTPKPMIVRNPIFPFNINPNPHVYKHHKDFIFSFRRTDFIADYKLNFNIEDLDSGFQRDTLIHFNQPGDLYTSNTSTSFSFLEPNRRYKIRVNDAWDNNILSTELSTGETDDRWQILQRGNSPIKNKIRGTEYNPESNEMTICSFGCVDTDGVNWRNVITKETTNYKTSDNIVQVVSDTKGKHYYRTPRNVTEWDGNEYKVWNKNTGVMRDFTEGIVVDKDGKLLVLSSNTLNGYRISVYDNGGSSVMPYPINERKSIFLQRYGDEVGTIINGEFMVINGFEWNRLDLGLPKDESLLRLKKSYNGSIIAETDQSTYFKSQEADPWQRNGTILKYEKLLVQAMDIQGWLYTLKATAEGAYLLIRGKNDDYELFLEKGFPFPSNIANRITRMEFDINGRIWFFAQEEGVFIFSPNGKLKEQTITLNTELQINEIPDEIDLLATATSGLPVTFQILEGEGKIVGNTLYPEKKDGKIKIRAMQVGDTEFLPAKDVAFEIDLVAKLSQTLTVELLKANYLVGENIEIKATSNVGLSPKIEIIVGEGAINNNIVSPSKDGLFKVKISQAGNPEYAPAESVELSFCVVPQQPNIIIDRISNTLSIQDQGATYRWFLNDTLLSGLTSAAINISQYGRYSVEQLNRSEECPASVSEAFVFLPLATEPLGSGVYLYPNPVGNVINLNGAYSNATFSIIDSRGMQVRKGVLKAASLDVSILSSGNYFLIINKSILRFVKR